MKFFGMGFPELLIILGVVLLIFGPKNLPKLGSALGKTVKNMRSGMESGAGSAEDRDVAGCDEGRSSSSRGVAGAGEDAGAHGESA